MLDVVVSMGLGQPCHAAKGRHLRSVSSITESGPWERGIFNLGMEIGSVEIWESE